MGRFTIEPVEQASRTRGDRGNRCNQATNVKRIHSNIGLVAGVDRCREFRLPFVRQRESRGEENKTLSSRNLDQVLGQAAQTEEKRISAEIRLGIANTGY